MIFKGYDEIDSEVARLYNEKRYEEAIDLLKSVLEEYPDNLYTITWDMAVIYTLLVPVKIEKSMDILEYGYGKGLWYSLNPESKLWESCRESARFKELVAKNNERKEQFQAKAEAKYEVYLPENYCEERSYPLHIAIHGWGEDISFFRKFWQSDVLNKDYISLFVQSSRVANPIGFCWDDIELARQEIQNAYEKVLVQYHIDISNITVGGFSQGGTMTIDTALNGLISIKGFIALCPGNPDSFSKEGIESMIEKKIKGIILTGEKDGSLPEQNEMVKTFEETGFSHLFIVNTDLGHWFPENLSEQIDEALAYIEL